MKFNVFSTFSLKNTIFFTAFLGWKEFSINFATAIDPWCIPIAIGRQQVRGLN